MKKYQRWLMVLMGGAGIMVASLGVTAKGWEPVRTDVSGLTAVASDGDLEVRVVSGHVVISTSQQVQIKIFTILGQVVSNETIPAGVSRLSLSHGVYIVKVGDLTCKIAV